MKYRVKCTVKARVPREENRAKVGWHKLPTVILEADTIEEITEQAYQIPAPDDIDIEALHMQGTIYLDIGDRPGRQHVSFNVFREL